MKQMPLLLMLFAVALSSGCIGSARADVNDESFVTNETMVFVGENIATEFISGEQGIAEFTVYNKGSKIVPAKNVRIALYDTYDLRIEKLICVSTTDEEPVPETINGQESACSVDEMPYGAAISTRYFLRAPDVEEDLVDGSLKYSVNFDYALNSTLSVPVTTESAQIETTPTDLSVHLYTQAAPIDPVITIGTNKVLLDLPFSFSLSFKNNGGSGGQVARDPSERKGVIRKENVELILPEGMTISNPSKCGFNCTQWLTYDTEDELKNAYKNKICKPNDDKTITIAPENNYLFESNGKTQPLKCDFKVTGTLSQRSLTKEIGINVKEFTYEYRKEQPITIRGFK